MPAALPRRYHGDGLDGRWPASLSRVEAQPAVIDLTADDGSSGSSSRPTRTIPRVQRPPRFAREIIDLEADVAYRTDALDVPPESQSPEIQFIESRRLPTPPPPPQDRYRPAQRNADGDDVEIVGSNTLPPEQRRRRTEEYLRLFNEDMNQFAHLRQRVVERVTNNMNMLPPTFSRTVRDTNTGRRLHVTGFAPPNFDFETVGFNLTNPGGPPPPPPTYDAPGPAAKGFTRSPAEEDVLICPNCEDELCVGDSDLKKQVWIVRACGHVYCGECAKNRSSKRTAKGKEKVTPANHKPFKECLVEGCNKKVSFAKAMLQVFL